MVFYFLFFRLGRNKADIPASTAIVANSVVLLVSVDVSEVGRDVLTMKTTVATPILPASSTT